ncbi:TrgA family protein [Aliiroseovarius crassostreae]|uniref:TrgA family protein n=1 Tax=Aliiroseovarius crassostreae TaxID=154981 RepID=UPI002204E271|nr:TrgA family protein [Aliiroseovarius crassostreae]UWP87863.1 TrgA family protein [Aliiroseovarius crassostreae]UWP97327.1 TrgA family protein [Aliiroseovarius crassostreae]UWQ00483.1 TrgA family protein [Aliiroseovarius crassostreae]UWQ06788.1 TrgA family protein [Aliiroseovarius crassostreae]UWQ09890.1 TrgA family protein [Aliiroseovarius crassostreae]
MPTAAKLVAAGFFAALAFMVGNLIIPYLAEGRDYTLFPVGLAGLGLAIGWRFTGYRIGRGLGEPVGIGLSSGALLVFWGFLVFSIYEMLRKTLRNAYDGPVEALRAAVKIAVDYGYDIAQMDVIATLVLGSVFGGWLTGVVARRWS